jgi:GNAT superfamily N-acetyltransferase
MGMPLIHAIVDAVAHRSANECLVVDRKSLMTQARLVVISPHEREDLEAAVRDFEQHFAELLHLPDGQVPRTFERDPFATPGLEVYWLDWQGKRYGFLVLDRVKLPPAETEGEMGFPQVEATQINRYGVFSEFRNQGLGSAGLPLIEGYAMASRRPLTWSCWLINPALRFWERWVQGLVHQGWRVEKRPRDSSPPARTYIAWSPEPG